MSPHRYDVAISYAGEDRGFADELVRTLESREITVYYDQFERALAWGERLTSRLTEIYEQQARFCLMLISQHSVGKAYPGVEREAALERAFTDLNYILPVRLDDSDVPGLSGDIAFLKVPPETPETIADAVAMKLGKTPWGLLPPDTMRQIRSIMQDPSSKAMDKTAGATIHATSALDKRREELLAELKEIDDGVARRMALREEHMEAGGHQAQIEAMKPQVERDDARRKSVMAELDGLTKGRQWFAEQMKAMNQRSSEMIKRLLSE